MFRKSYFVIFVIGILLLITGYVITAIGGFIPEVDYGDSGYNQYKYLMRLYAALSNLFQNVGIVLFSFATFLGAFKDDTLSNDLKRALIITSGLSLIALVLFNVTIRIYSPWFWPT